MAELWTAQLVIAFRTAGSIWAIEMAIQGWRFSTHSFCARNTMRLCDAPVAKCHRVSGPIRASILLIPLISSGFLNSINLIEFARIAARLYHNLSTGDTTE